MISLRMAAVETGTEGQGHYLIPNGCAGSDNDGSKSEGLG